MSLPPGPLGLQTLQAELTRLVLPIGLTLDRVTLAGGPATMEPNPFSLSLANPAKLQAEISAASLQAFLAKNLPNTLRDPQVTLESGSIRVTVVVKILLAEVRTGLRAGLEIVGGRQLHVVLRDVDVPAARALVERQLQEQNPIFDAAMLPVRLTLESVSIEPSAVRLAGTVTP